MSIYCYEIRSSIDFFKKLLDEREDFLRSPTSSRHALNCAFTAWHMHEWVYNEYTTLKSQYPRDKDFRDHILKQDGMMEMRDLTDGAKHFQISRANKIITGTRLVAKGEIMGLRTMQDNILMIQFRLGNAGCNMAFHDVLFSATHFWYLFFKECLGEDVSFFSKEYTLFGDGLG